jgi:hypothetical protein
MTGGGLGTVVAMLIALPFVALADWFGWINKQRYPELAKACHGVGMVALVAVAIGYLGGLVDFVARFVAHPGDFFWVIPAGITVWGLGWFLHYARHAALVVARPYRAVLTTRALLKLGIGSAAWAYTGVLAEFGVIALLLQIFSVWCLSTGATQLGLMWWGKKHGQAEQMVQGDITRNQFDWDDDGTLR